VLRFSARLVLRPFYAAVQNSGVGRGGL